jgi:hypothetical protein
MSLRIGTNGCCCEHGNDSLGSIKCWEFLEGLMNLSPSLSLILWSTVSRPVCLGTKHPSGAYDQIFLLSDSCGFLYVGRSLWREDGSVVYNCPWPLPPQSSLGLTPVGLVTVSDSRLHFSSPPTTRRVTVEVIDPASTREFSAYEFSLTWFASGLTLTQYKTLLQIVLLLRAYPLPR